MKQFNTRLFLWLLGLTAAATGGVFLVHYLQTGRIAQALLWQARRAEEQGHPEETSRYLARYLEFVPDDHEQRANLGRVLATRVLDGDPEKVTDRLRQQALFVLEGVVAREPDRQDLRRQLARIALGLGRTDVAAEHLTRLHDELPADGEVTCLLAECREAQEKYADAALLYWDAVGRAPRHEPGYVRLALLLRRPDRPAWKAPATDPDHVLTKKPEEVLDLLVANNPGSSQAHLDRWWGRHDEARDPARRAVLARDVEEALRLAPTEADVLLAAADLARIKDDLRAARDYLGRGCALHPDDRQLHLARADVELADGKPDKAVECLNAGLQALPEQKDLLWLLANVYLDRKDLARARQTVERLGKANGSPSGLDYLKARMLCLEGKWAEAAQLLESNRPVMERDGAVPGLLDQADLYLATCYEQTDEPLHRLAAYERVLLRAGGTGPAAPAVLTALLGRARANWDLNHLDEAVTQYRELLQRPDAPKAAAAELARVLVARQLARGERDWRDVRAILDQAARAQPDAPDAPLLRAHLLMLDQQWDQARAELEKARRAFPKKVEPWAALIELAEAQGQRAEVTRLLGAAERDVGDKVELRLARARAWAADAADKRGPFPAALADGRDRFPAEEQVALLEGLMEVAYRAGALPEALRLWEQLAGLPEHRHDARTKLVLIELALEAGDQAALTRVFDDVRRIEGGEGPLWSYGEALRLLRGCRPGNDPAALDRAAALLERVESQRPGWAAVQLADADVEKLRRNPDAAIRHYQKALELDEHNPRVRCELARLLDERGRSAEADKVLRDVPAQALGAGDVRWLAAAVALRNNDPARAFQLTRGAVAADSTDYRDYLRRGEVLAADGQAEKAEQDLRRATDLAGDRPETWLALVGFLARAGRADQARKAIEAARAKLPPDQAPQALAACYEAAGDREAAGPQYQKALEQRPADFAVRRAAANFYLRGGRTRDAEALIRPLVAGQVKAADNEVSWARRTLALVLAGYPDEAHFTEGLALVGLKWTGSRFETDDPAAGGPPEEQRELTRTRAQVLAGRDDRQACRAAAIALLEDLARRGALAPDDGFLLARLYEANGPADEARARKLLVDLAANHGDNPTYLAHYVRSLLRQKQADEAGRQADRLAALEKAAKVEPGAWGSVELRAEVLEARGEGRQAIDLLRAHAGRPNARPEDRLLLVGSLSRQRRFAEALAECDELWRTAPAPVAAPITLAVLRAARPTDEQCARVEGRLREASAKAPGQPTLLLHLADLYDLRADYARAAECYRRVLTADRDNAVALNNLAWLLAETSGSKDEALDLIRRAIRLQGERADFLDTRAAVALAKHDAASAVRDLRQAIADGPTGSRYFRLSLAYHQAGDVEAARAAWQRAKALGLKPEQLHPIEQTAFRKATSELDPH